MIMVLSMHIMKIVKLFGLEVKDTLRILEEDLLQNLVI